MNDEIKDDTGFTEKISAAVDSALWFIAAILSVFANPKHFSLYWMLTGSAMVVLCGESVYSLFTVKFGLSAGVALLSVIASVGVLVLIAAISVNSSSNAEKGLGYMMMTIWIPLVIGLISLNAVIKDGWEPPKNLIAIGRITAMILPGIAVLPFILLTIAKRNTDRFPTASIAVAHYFKVMFAVVLLLSSTFANINFGDRLGLEAEVATLLGVILESMYLWSVLQGIRAEHNKDKFDVIVWSLVQTTNVLFLGFVAIETVATLAGFKIPFIENAQETGKVIYVGAIMIGLVETLVSELLTRWINWPSDEAKPKSKTSQPAILNRRSNGIVDRILPDAKPTVSFNSDSNQSGKIHIPKS